MINKKQIFLILTIITLLFSGCSFPKQLFKIIHLASTSGMEIFSDIKTQQLLCR